MTRLARHCLLSLLLIVQSLSSAWGQAHIANAMATVNPTMQAGRDCEAMKSFLSIRAETSVEAPADAVPGKSPLNCPCCSKQCPPTHCAATALVIALPTALAPALAFLPLATPLGAFAQRTRKHFSTPPTPPPNPLS